MYKNKHLTRLRRIWIDDPVYFITVSTEHRNRVLAEPDIHDLLREELRSAAERHGWQVGRYAILPDHVHFFCAQVSEGRPLGQFIGLWKQWTAKQINRLRGTSGSFWQREFFDHLLRDEQSAEVKWNYVWENPIRHGLVRKQEDWPYQGEIHPL